jgi:hypothetical protein
MIMSESESEYFKTQQSENFNNYSAWEKNINSHLYSNSSKGNSGEILNCWLLIMFPFFSQMYLFY